MYYKILLERTNEYLLRYVKMGILYTNILDQLYTCTEFIWNLEFYQNREKGGLYWMFYFEKCKKRVYECFIQNVVGCPWV